jgi:hypothetical protein
VKPLIKTTFVALVALVPFVAPAAADVGSKTAVEFAFQTVEKFRAKWNSLLDKAKGRSVNHTCQDDRCSWTSNCARMFG